MNKFGKATEEDFETVADVIKKMIEKSSNFWQIDGNVRIHTLGYQQTYEWLTDVKQKG